MWNQNLSREQRSKFLVLLYILFAILFHSVCDTFAYCFRYFSHCFRCLPYCFCTYHSVFAALQTVLFPKLFQFIFQDFFHSILFTSILERFNPEVRGSVSAASTRIRGGKQPSERLRVVQAQPGGGDSHPASSGRGGVRGSSTRRTQGILITKSLTLSQILARSNQR